MVVDSAKPSLLVVILLVILLVIAALVLASRRGGAKLNKWGGGDTSTPLAVAAAAAAVAAISAPAMYGRLPPRPAGAFDQEGSGEPSRPPRQPRGGRNDRGRGARGRDGSRPQGRDGREPRSPSGEPPAVLLAPMAGHAASLARIAADPRLMASVGDGSTWDANRAAAEQALPGWQHRAVLAAAADGGAEPAFAGYIRWRDDGAELLLLVDPAWQRRSVGMQALERALLEADTEAVVASLPASNLPMAKALSRAGYVDTDAVRFEGDERWRVFRGEAPGGAARPRWPARVAPGCLPYPGLRWYAPPAAEMWAAVCAAVAAAPAAAPAEAEPPCLARSYPDDYIAADGLSNHYTEGVRRACRFARDPSFLRVWAEQIRPGLTAGEPLALNDQLWKATRACNTFNPTFAGWAIRNLVGPGAAVLDGSAGWGDRMVGAAAAGARRYCAFDPNAALVAGHTRLRRFLEAQAPGFSAEVHVLPFEEARLEPRSFDCFISSPPFSALEVYSAAATQSSTRYPSDRLWVEGFYRAYLRTGWEAVRAGGAFCLYIHDLPHLPLAKIAQKMFAEWGDAEFLGAYAHYQSSARWPTPASPEAKRPMWVWRRQAALPAAIEGGAAPAGAAPAGAAAPPEFFRAPLVRGEKPGDPGDYEALRRRLNAAKAQLDEIPPDLYSGLATAYDPYLTLKKAVAAETGIAPVTNASLKIREIVMELGLVPTADSRFHFEAEFPGAMVVSMLALAPGLDWVAGSLMPAAGRDALEDIYGMYRDHRDRWLMGPRPNAMPEGWPDVDGDLTVPATVAALAAAARARWGGRGATHYMADGGFGVEDFSRQEEATAPLNRGQIACGLLSLEEGGCLMTKQYTFFEPRSRAVIAYLASVFAEFWVVKPRTSRRLNSEVYLVGRGFLGLPELDRALLELGDFPPADPGLVEPALWRAAEALCGAQVAALDELAAGFRRRQPIRLLRQERADLHAAWQREWRRLYLGGAASPAGSPPPSGEGAFGGRGAPPLGRFDLSRLRPDLARAVAAVADLTLPPPPVALAADTPRLPYQARDPRRDHRTCLHVGQRKLLMSEVDFLAQCAREGDIVVYAGSAPGIHIPWLARLFRRLGLQFELYDPAPFRLPGRQIEPWMRIRTHNEYFTDEVAAAWAGRDDVLFVSDIRSGSHREEGFEEEVARNMEMQKRWVEIMRPRAIMLKCRFPYDSDEPTPYFAGDLHVQAFAPGASTELRLIAERPYGEQMYDPRRVEEQMFYVNNVLREWAFYDHGVDPALVEGLDHCYDCAVEIEFWRAYLRWAGKPDEPTEIARLMNETAAAILGRSLRTACHGILPDVPMIQKREYVLAQCSGGGGDP